MLGIANLRLQNAKHLLALYFRQKKFQTNFLQYYFRKESPKYANVEEMVKTMSVASLFHHVRRRNK